MLSCGAKIRPRQEYSKALDNPGEVLLTGGSRNSTAPKWDFFSLMRSAELCSLEVQKAAEEQEKIIQAGMPDSDRLLLQKRGQAKAHTRGFQAAGAESGGAAPVPSNLAWTGGGWVLGNLTGLLLPTEPSQQIPEPLMSLANWHIQPP